MVCRVAVGRTHNRQASKQAGESIWLSIGTVDWLMIDKPVMGLASGSIRVFVEQGSGFATACKYNCFHMVTLRS